MVSLTKGPRPPKPPQKRGSYLYLREWEEGFEPLGKT